MQVLRNRQKKSGNKKYRFVKGNTAAAPRKRKPASNTSKKAPARNSVKKTRPSETRASAKGRVRKPVRKLVNRTPASIDAPGWKDLKTAENGRIDSKLKDGQLLSTLSTVKTSLGILAAAVLMSLYVGHVQATQDLVNEVYQARKENLSLSTFLDKKQGEYNSKIGPAAIYPRAYELGLKEGRGTEQPVVVGARQN